MALPWPDASPFQPHLEPAAPYAHSAVTAWVAGINSAPTHEAADPTPYRIRANGLACRGRGDAGHGGSPGRCLGEHGLAHPEWHGGGQRREEAGGRRSDRQTGFRAQPGGAWLGRWAHLEHRRRHPGGVVTQAIDSPFYGVALRGIEDELDKAGYSSLFVSGQWNASEETRCIETLRARRVDGIIVLTGRLSDTALRTVARTMPVVVTGRHLTGTQLASLDFDNFEGARLATDHLLAWGHRQIAFITGDPAHPDANERLRGYRSAIEAVGDRGGGPRLRAGARGAGSVHRRERFGRGRSPARQRSGFQRHLRGQRSDGLWRQPGAALARPEGAARCLDRRIRRPAHRSICAATPDHRAPPGLRTRPAGFSRSRLLS